MSERGTGTTSAQMREAPSGAAFVWPVARTVDYARRLARHLDRTDLVIVGPNGIRGLSGRTLPAIIPDHACSMHLGARERDDLFMVQEALRKQFEIRLREQSRGLRRTSP